MKKISKIEEEYFTITDWRRNFQLDAFPAGVTDNSITLLVNPERVVQFIEEFNSLNTNAKLEARQENTIFWELEPGVKELRPIVKVNPVVVTITFSENIPQEVFQKYQEKTAQER
jgi:hypothetical protein